MVVGGADSFLLAQFSPPSAGGGSFRPSAPSARSYSPPSTGSYGRTNPTPGRFNQPSAPNLSAPGGYGAPGYTPRRPTVPTGSSPFSASYQRLPGNQNAPFRGVGSSIGPVFRNPIGMQPTTPHYDQNRALSSIAIPMNAPAGDKINPASYTSANTSTLQSQIDANLANDRSLESMMQAVNAIDRLAPNASFASKYRVEALQQAQQDLARNRMNPLPWIATAKLSAQTGNDALFRQTSQQFVVQFPENPYAHYFKGMQAIEDQDWKAAEISLKNAESLGMSKESIAQMLKVAIDNQKWVWQYAEIIFWIVMIWLAGLTAIYLLGRLLSRYTLGSIDRNQLDAHSVSTRLIRRLYRNVVSIAGIYYYLSLPVILISAILLPLAIGYAALHTPYLNLVLLVLILIGGLGGILTAISGIRTALLRVPENEDGMSLKPHESAKFWNMVRSVAEEVGTRSVDEIWITPGTDLAVTERGSWWAKMHDRGRRVLIFGVALIDGMTTDSLRSILAHEYTHFRNRDTAGGDIALRVRYAMHRFADTIAERGNVRWWDLTVHFLRIFHRLFTQLTLGASRLQELMADRAAVELFGSTPFINGLKHVIERDVEFDLLVNKAITRHLRSDAPIVHFFTARRWTDVGDTLTIDGNCHAIIHRQTTIYDSHPSPIERFSNAHKLNIQKQLLAQPVAELFDQDASLLCDEMSVLLSDLTKARAGSVIEFNGLLINALDEAIRNGNDDLRYERARLQFQLSHYDESLEDVDWLMKQSKQSPEIRWLRAVILRAAGRHDDSLVEIQELIRRERSIDTDLVCQALRSKGEQLWQLGRLEEAENAFDHLVRLAPESYDALAGRLALAEARSDTQRESIVQLKESIDQRWPDFGVQEYRDNVTAPSLVRSSAMLVGQTFMP